ncbi:Uncharacterized protein GBIM_07287, partial [Gryllus bimaculatus]
SWSLLVVRHFKKATTAGKLGKKTNKAAQAVCRIATKLSHLDACPSLLIYFQQWQDLLKHMFKMHIHPYVPRVIIVEKLNYYCKLFPEEENIQEKYEHEVHSAKICASLIDATSVCAKRCKNDTVLLVSFEQNQRQGNLVNMIVDTYFSSTLWLFDETNEENKDIISIKSSSCAGLGKHAKLEFIHLKESETLILQKIVNFAGLTQ